MLAASPEQNRHKKDDNHSETNPPGKHEHWQPAWLSIDLRTEDARHAIGQSTQVATTMKPMIMAMTLPKLLPRLLVNIPHRKMPRSEP